MIIFVIPTYNERENLPVLFNSISMKMSELGYPYKIYLIDDGSTDGALQFVREECINFPVDILEHSRNLGTGAAFRTGFNAVANAANDNDIVVTLESDNTSDLNILNAMIRKIEQGFDVVLASCYARGGSVEHTTLFRIWLSRTANFLIKKLFGIKTINTFSSFYRVHNAHFLKKAMQCYNNKLIEENGFTCAVEMFIKFWKINCRITEVPMVLRGNCRKGKSKMRIMRNICDYFRLFYRLKFQVKL